MMLNEHPTKDIPDIVVVGGGPAGSFVAFCLGQLGAKVTVFEEHPAIGFPSHCAGHLSIRGLTELGLYPLPKKIVENEFSRARFFSPSGFEFSVGLNKPVTCAVNREAFDQYLSNNAIRAGAQLSLNSRVQSLVNQNGFAKGLRIRQANEAEKIVSAKIVVDAEGISSRMLRQAGLISLNRNKLVHAVQAEVENVKDVEMDAVEVFLGKEYAPGFYAWIIPRLDGSAKVGLATEAGDPREFLRRLMQKHPIASKQLGKARVTRMAFHPISLGGPISRAYSNGFLAVGDVASQVKSTTGGGVILGLTCAKIAAEVAFEAIRRNDCSANQLESYQKRCKGALGFDVGVMLRMRSFLDRLSDFRLESAMRFCSKIGMGESLRDVDEIDFQGQTLMKVLKKPVAFPVLAYFFMLFLSANL